MPIVRTLPCAVTSREAGILFRDLGRAINYLSPAGEIAEATATGLSASGWSELPPWVRRLEASRSGSDIRLEVIVEPDTDPAAGAAAADALAEDLRELFGHPARPFGRRVFCIGWPKTGTTSLTGALRRLGLFSWHFAPWLVGCHRIDSEAAPSIDFDGLADYTAMSDLPVCVLFRELDAAFPGSLFIFTERSLGGWMESEQAHLNSQDGLYGIDRWAYGEGPVNETTLCERYLRHREAVFEHFAGRDDLLVLDLARGDPWQPLCRFLDLPAPRLPFPRLNRRRNAEGRTP
jgi:hypothetical protein